MLCGAALRGEVRARVLRHLQIRVARAGLLSCISKGGFAEVSRRRWASGRRVRSAVYFVAGDKHVVEIDFGINFIIRLLFRCVKGFICGHTITSGHNMGHDMSTAEIDPGDGGSILSLSHQVKAHVAASARFRVTFGLSIFEKSSYPII